MNLLAHAVLSPDIALVRVGNVAADFLARPDEIALTGDLAEGVLLHRRIDTITDKHEAVKRACGRLIGYQRFSNPIVDVFFDYFLVNNWPLAVPVEAYVHNLHAEILEHLHLLPENTQFVLRRMIQDEWLLSYSDFDGLRTTFHRMEKRILHRSGRAVDMAGAVELFESQIAAFELDFREFWPDLVQSVSTE
jgi:acyl carrier protein phosphodiesterase